MRRRIGDVSAKHRSRQSVRTGKCRFEQGRGGHRSEQGRVEPGVAQRQAAEVSKLQDNCSDVSAEAYKFFAPVKLGWNSADWKTQACMTMTATSGVVSAKNAVFNARGYLPIEERVKKVRLKHGRDRERTSACMAAGHSIDSILSSAKPTLVPKGKKNDSRQGCVYWLGTRRDIRLPFVMGYTQTHEGWSRAQKQVLRQRQPQKNLHTICTYDNM